MLQPSRAARRFFHAFYQWNVPLCSSHLHHPAKRTLIVSTARARREPGLHRQNVLQQHDAPADSQPQTSGDTLTLDESVQASPASLPGLPRSWRASTPVTSAERPIHRFAPFEEAVREISDSGILVQMPVPQLSLVGLYTRYGPDLAGLAQTSGARVAVSEAGITSYTRLRKPILSSVVTFSGTFEQCLVVRAKLRAGRQHLKDLLKSPRMARSHTINKKTDTGIEQNLRSASASLKPVDLKTASTPEISSTSLHPSTSTPATAAAGTSRKVPWLSYPVQTYTDMPSHRLRPFRLVVRHRSELRNSYFVEFVVPKKHWTYITALMPLSQIQQFCQASVILADHFASGRLCRITVEGTAAHVDEAVDLLFGLIDRAKEYLKARWDAKTQVPSKFVPYVETNKRSLESDGLLVDKTNVEEKSLKNDQFEIPSLFSPPIAKDLPSPVSTTLPADTANAIKSSAMHSSRGFRTANFSHDTFSSRHDFSPVHSYRSVPLESTFNFAVSPTLGSGASPMFTTLRAYTTQSRAISMISGLRYYSNSAMPRTHSYKSSGDTSKLSEDLKRAFRPLTHPVALITSRMSGEGQTDDDLNHCRGVTVSSFNTVTMSPTPVVSFNLRVPSRSWDAIKSLRKMTIHLLSATHGGATVANAFTQPYEQPGEPFRRLRNLGVDVEFTASASNDNQHYQSPHLSWNDAVIAQIDAVLLGDKCVEVGDHVVVFAEVTSLALPHEATSSVEYEPAVDRSEGLAYALQGFRGVGPVIEPLELPTVQPGLSKNVEPRTPPKWSSTISKRGNANAAVLLSANSAGSTSTTDHQRRSYSTSHSTTPRQSPRQRVNTQGPRPTHDMVSDPALLSSTVDDFLGIPYRRTNKSRRIRGLIRLQTAAQEASQQLESKLADGSLTPEDSARLENIVTRNERAVAKTLALRSAQDLQSMLDENKIDSRRVQWIESSVEKGQAVLLEEARELRRLLDEKAITLEQFEPVKTKLEEENTLLSTELMRLRQLVDEESEGGMGGKETAKFDGFGGNV